MPLLPDNYINACTETAHYSVTRFHDGWIYIANGQLFSLCIYAEHQRFLGLKQLTTFYYYISRVLNLAPSMLAVKALTPSEG